MCTLWLAGSAIHTIHEALKFIADSGILQRRWVFLRLCGSFPQHVHVCWSQGFAQDAGTQSKRWRSNYDTVDGSPTEQDATGDVRVASLQGDVNVSEGGKDSGPVQVIMAQLRTTRIGKFLPSAFLLLVQAFSAGIWRLPLPNSSSLPSPPQMLTPNKYLAPRTWSQHLLPETGNLWHPAAAWAGGFPLPHSHSPSASSIERQQQTGDRGHAGESLSSPPPLQPLSTHTRGRMWCLLSWWHVLLLTALLVWG